VTYCSECPRRVVVLPHPGRNPKSQPKRVAMKHHELCRQCHRRAMSAEMARQRA